MRKVFKVPFFFFFFFSCFLFLFWPFFFFFTVCLSGLRFFQVFSFLPFHQCFLLWSFVDKLWSGFYLFICLFSSWFVLLGSLNLHPLSLDKAITVEFPIVQILSFYAHLVLFIPSHFFIVFTFFTSFLIVILCPPPSSFFFFFYQRKPSFTLLNLSFYQFLSCCYNGSCS